eukprot:1160276-Pelagomonas_calceolata.AAC.21
MQSSWTSLQAVDHSLGEITGGGIASQVLGAVLAVRNDLENGLLDAAGMGEEYKRGERRQQRRKDIFLFGFPTASLHHLHCKAGAGRRCSNMPRS